MIFEVESFLSHKNLVGLGKRADDAGRLGLSLLLTESVLALQSSYRLAQEAW